MKYSYEFDINSNTAPANIARRIKNKSTILEFGTAHGILTKYLKENLECQVYGIELDPDFAEIASVYTEAMHIGDIESFEWVDSFEELKCDYIIFSDVLEHLKDPKKVLIQSKRFLNPSGSILLSIPNMAHSSIVLGLLKNNFNYTETGLLDKTHLRFFTKITIDNLINECGYYTNYEAGIFIPPHRTERMVNYTDYPICVSNYIRENKYSEVYQFVYEISLNKDKEYCCEYNNKYFVKVSIGSELDGDSEEIYNGFVEEAELSDFNFQLKENKTIQYIHVLIDNIYSSFYISSFSINQNEIESYNVNAKKINNVFYPKETSLGIYLPLFDKIKLKEISFSVNKCKYEELNVQGISDCASQKNNVIGKIFGYLLSFIKK